MKKVYVFLIAVVLLAAGALAVFYRYSAQTELVAEEGSGFGGGRTAQAATETEDLTDLSPAQTVEEVLFSLQRGDYETFDALIHYSGNSVTRMGDDDLDDVQELFRDLEFEIGDEVIDGDDAYVEVLITSYDIDTGELYEDDLDDLGTLGDLIKDFTSGVMETISSDEEELHLVLRDGVWKIQVDAAFVKVITGGVLSNLF